MMLKMTLESYCKLSTGTRNERGYALMHEIIYDTCNLQRTIDF